MYSRQSLTYLFVIMAIIVVLLSLWLSNRLVKELADEERRKIEIWAMATESMLMDEEMDMSLVLRILESNTTIPIILYDKSSGKLTPRNIKLPEEDAESYLQTKIVEFGRRHDPIALLEMNQLLYYDDFAYVEDATTLSLLAAIGDCPVYRSCVFCPEPFTKGGAR